MCVKYQLKEGRMCSTTAMHHTVHLVLHTDLQDTAIAYLVDSFPVTYTYILAIRKRVAVILLHCYECQQSIGLPHVN